MSEKTLKRFTARQEVYDAKLKYKPWTVLFDSGGGKWRGGLAGLNDDETRKVLAKLKKAGAHVVIPKELK